MNTKKHTITTLKMHEKPPQKLVVISSFASALGRACRLLAHWAFRPSAEAVHGASLALAGNTLHKQTQANEHTI